MTLDPTHSREVQLRMSCAFCSAHILVGLVELREGRFFRRVCERTSDAKVPELRNFAANPCAVLAALDATGD